MEKISQIIGRWFYKFNLYRLNLLNKTILKNQTNFALALVVVFGILPSLILILFSGWNLSWAQKATLVAGDAAFIWIMILLAASFFEFKKLQAHNSFGIRFIQLNLSTIDYVSLMFDNMDIENFKRLVWGTELKGKINYRIKPISKIGGNYMVLFTFLDLIIEGGIAGYQEERRRAFFNFIQNAFLIDSEAVKYSSCDTGFSKWKNKYEAGNLVEETDSLKKILGFKNK
jgi:hypothetical protein